MNHRFIRASALRRFRSAERQRKRSIAWLKGDWSAAPTERDKVLSNPADLPDAALVLEILKASA